MAQKRRGRPRKPKSEQKVYKPTGKGRGRPRKTSSEEALLSSPKTRKRKSTSRKKKILATIVKIHCGTKGYMDYLVGRKVKLKTRPNWVGEEFYYGIIMSPGYEGTPMMFSKDELVLDNPEEYKDDSE
jgi:hypothetical protein